MMDLLWWCTSIWLLVYSALAEDVDHKTFNTTAALHGHSLMAPYIEENLNNRWWDFGGDAVVDVNSHIRLTEDMQSRTGWLWSRTTMTSSSWIVEFEFKIHGNEYGLHGDGFAFWFTTERELEGPVFGNKDQFTGLGVFFDTYANGRQRYTFPYISAMVGDGQKKYDNDNDGNAHSIGGCPAEIRGIPHPTKARVTYVRGQYLQVELDILGDNLWRECFLTTNVTLPYYGFLGFTALTGEVSDHHDIISISSTGIIHAPDYHGQNHQGNLGGAFGSVGGSFISTLFWILLILGGVGGAYYYFKVRTQSTRGYKRF